MPAKILLGPLLGLEGDSSYTVCFLASKDLANPQLVVDGQPIPADRIGETPQGTFWRLQFPVKVQKTGRFLQYQITSNGTDMPDTFGRPTWNFYVPGSQEVPRLAYASCNGFSSGDMKTKLDDPYGMWKRLIDDHSRDPLSLLIMGGDQIYADEIWHSRRRTPLLGAWSRLKKKDKLKAKATQPMRHELDKFYESLYTRHWDQEDMSLMLASIPSVMMWDDHDIFDGWGSYPESLQKCEVFQAIFATASRYFELIQLRSKRNATLLNPQGDHYSFGFLFRDFGILGLDNRSNRTETIVMGEQNWTDVKTWLRSMGGKLKNLIVLSAVPVVYRDFTSTETVFDITPWEEELADDIRDHWRSRYHEGERMKLIMNLLDFNPASGDEEVKRLILSGDVHIGCLGIVRDEREHITSKNRSLFQVVSSGIVHPSPKRTEWLGILAGSNDRPERLAEGPITSELLEPFGSGKYLRTRNYVTLKEGTDSKLWINWVCEDGRTPAYPLTGSH